MTRRVTLEWPDPAPFRDRNGASIRILAVSDILEPTFLDARNRSALAPIDFIVGCGDLDYDDLAFITDGFNAPLLYVHGNHDTNERWRECHESCPEPIQSTAIYHQAGLSIAGLTWPGVRGKRGHRSETAAWNQAMRLATRRLGRLEPLIVLSHVPPLGSGDVASDAYHRGFKGYRWLLQRLEPILWLHGHTPLAATRDWQTRAGPTTIVNVTGAVLIELTPPQPGTRPRRRLGLREGAKADANGGAVETNGGSQGSPELPKGSDSVL
jgi:Icc-related predicted phosphoesterase